MAASEGAAAQTASAYEGGGVGGKFRKRPFRRSQTTPYERPPTALRNPSWLSKLVVDPASKLLAAGAQRLFSSVFPKRLPPPPLPPSHPTEEKQNSRNAFQETVQDSGTHEAADVVGGSSICKNDTSGISELEQLLKQKTFTRSEIDRLSELLLSRAVDDEKSSETNLSNRNNILKPMSDTEMHQEFPLHLEGNKIEKMRDHGAVSTPTTSKKLLEDEIASPAQLAKAYMGSTSRIAGKDAGSLISSPFISKPPMTSLGVTPTGHLGVAGNGFTTPRSRGRTAIYNMARTPYSRQHPTAVQKVSGPGNYSFSRPSSSASQSLLDDGVQSGSKPVALKRRFSVLDDDIGSVGPIRRIRQKPNLLSHGILAPSRGRSLGSYSTHFHQVPLMNEPKNRASNTPSTSYYHVPPESSEMAAKIFEHLEKMTPKDKSSESKLAAARERSSFKLTSNMLHGQALRSLEDLDASKLLQSSQDNHKLGDKTTSSLPVSPDSTTQKKQGRVEKNGRSPFVHPVDKLAPVVNTDHTVIARNIKQSTEDAVRPDFVSQSHERKRGFKMSAHEDSLELDDDVPLNERASEAGKATGINKSTTESKSISSEGEASERMPALSEVRIGLDPVLSERTELDTIDAPIGGEEHTGTLSLSHASAKSSQPTALAAGPSILGDSPFFVSFGSRATGSAISTDSKAESSSSLMNVFGATGAKVPESDKNDTKSSQLLDGTVNGQPGIVASLASNLISTASIFSPGAPASSLVANNGPLASSASTWSSSSPSVPIKLSNQNFADSLSNMASPVGTMSSNGINSNTPASISSAPVLNFGSSKDLLASSSAASTYATAETATVAPSISSVPVFNFGSLKDPLAANSAASTDATEETTDSKIHPGKEKSSGKDFGSTSLAAASSGSSIVGLGSLVSSAAVNSQSQSSSTASGTVVSTQLSSTGQSTATVSLSVPVQFGSSSSATVFSAPGSSTSSSIFGSSALATSAPSSSASTSETNLINSRTVGAPIVFKFGIGSSASSEVNTVCSSSTAAPGTFTFGVSSAASSSPSNIVTPSLFSFGAGSSSLTMTTTSSTVPGIFSFGAGSTVSSSVTSSSASATSGIFSFGASSSGFSLPANAVTSSSGTSTIFSFGASNPASSSVTNSVSSGGASSSSFGSSWQAPTTPVFGSTFNTTSSTGFSFGASSSLFGTTNSSTMVFGSTAGTSSNPVFSFSAASGPSSSLTPSSMPSPFGNSASSFAAPPRNNDQMNTEDSMAEDPVQSSAPAASVFGQSPVSPSPQGFMFGSTAPSPAVPFQFGGPQNQAAPQNPLPFQQSGSLEFNAGGSFSLGSGGGDKSGRKIIKVNRNRNKKR